MTWDVRKSQPQVGLAYIRRVESGLQYPRTMMYGFFAKRTDPPSSSLLFWLPSSSFLSSSATFPDPLWSPIARSRDFHHVSGTIWQSDYWQSITHHFAFAYRFAYSGVTQRLCQSSWGHALFFRAVLPANTLVRWVNENAFVPEVQTRPCPTFGRPVHLGFPHRLQPGTSPHALRIPPYDGHPALRSTASSGSRSVLAISSFRFRARLDVSIPSASSGQRGYYPPLLDMAPLIWAPEGL